MRPLITVITPCYNHGLFLEEAISSLNLEKNKDFLELIVINDGSTDEYTLAKLKEFSEKGIRIINQENQGLAAARNIGIEYARGKYILPLDSDNKILPEVFAEAANIMENDASIDLVYTDAFYFGEKNGKWVVGSFDGLKLLAYNYIDACTLIRKETLVHSGGYDRNMPAMGNEDWELWVNFFLNKRKIFYLPKIGFHYRVTHNSMSVTSTRPNAEKNRQYIITKHTGLILNQFDSIIGEIINLKSKINSIEYYLRQNKFKSIIKILIGKKIV